MKERRLSLRVLIMMSCWVHGLIAFLVCSPLCAPTLSPFSVLKYLLIVKRRLEEINEPEKKWHVVSLFQFCALTVSNRQTLSYNPSISSKNYCSGPSLKMYVILHLSNSHSLIKVLTKYLIILSLTKTTRARCSKILS